MNIKKVIQEKGFTISSVAKQMTDKKGEKGITQSSLSQMIVGNPTVGTLRNIAEIIGCNITDFFADEIQSNENEDTSTTRCPHCGKIISVRFRTEFNIAKG